jgi:beta-glucosidase
MARIVAVCLAAAIIAIAVPAFATENPASADREPWLNRHLSPDARAALVLKQLTLDEKIQLVHSRFAKRDPLHPPPDGPEDELGYVPGIPRLHIPPLHMIDGSLGVANPWNARDLDEATALPSGLALAASWNPALAFESGAMAGAEARSRGFNVLLAGSINLVRDPRGGRSFEYAGEDPLLAGVMVGETIRGVQSRHVISTIKHFAVNDRESGRFVMSADMREKALRESDLLAFQIAIERGDPGAVMCAYNKVNGIYACENHFLLQSVLRLGWNYRGWIMSDWGAVHSTVQSVESGLDQESGDIFDKTIYFGDALKQAIETGAVPMGRLDVMVGHILRTMFAKAVIDDPAARHVVDESSHQAIAQRIAEQGMVLLKNAAQLLPLGNEASDIAVIGSHADRAVLSGGGSSQVRPVGGPALTLPPPDGTPKGAANMVWDPSSPLDAIKAQAPGARIRYADGTDSVAAAALAKDAKIAIVFVHQWMSEGWDISDLSLPDDQDRLIDAVVSANPRTIVVLETGGPVLMPWLARVGAVLEAWYPGQRGGEAMARILFGKVVPSGRLPVTFPRGEEQLPSAVRAVSGTPAADTNLRYGEGAAVGYRWFEEEREIPLFPFGYGLTYTSFTYGGLRVAHPPSSRRRVVATFTLRNSGRRAATEVTQIYVSRATSEGLLPRRLAGWKRIALRAGETRQVSIELDPHALQSWNSMRDAWETPAGDYRIEVGASASDDRLSARVTLR